MPLPLWDKKNFSEIAKMAGEIIKNKGSFEELDNYIMEKFAFFLQKRRII